MWLEDWNERRDERSNREAAEIYRESAATLG